MKRYAIVRVEGKCGKNLEYYECDYDCCDCRYGDTKEQLIRKVAKVINNFIIPHQLIDAFDKERLQKCYDLHKKLAKEIVEFLGVK